MPPIADTLRAAREERGMSQRALARKSGIPLNTISRIELGISHSPRLETLAPLAEALGVPLDQLAAAGETGQRILLFRRAGRWPRLAALGAAIDRLSDEDLRRLLDLARRLGRDAGGETEREAA